MAINLLPFPTLFTAPAGGIKGVLPVTREGVRNLPGWTFDKWPGPVFAKLNIRDRDTGRRSRGICGLLPASAFLDGTVRPHEKTLVSRLRRQEVLVLADDGALGKPVLLTVPSLKTWWKKFSSFHGGAGQIVNFTGQQQTYDLSVLQGDAHDVNGDFLGTHPFPIPELGPLCIADGHHRAETHARLAARGVTNCSHLPVCIIGADELSIEAFTRVIAAATPVDQLLLKLAPFFTVRPLANPLAPTQPGQWLLAHEGQHYQLNRRDRQPKSLDVTWLEEEVLPVVFGVTDSRLDERITFLPTPVPVDEQLHIPLEAGKTYLSGFPLPAASFFAEVAAHRCLPPKSTRFEPRVPSGLVVWMP